MAKITIRLTDEGITMPVDYRVPRGEPLTWEVRSGTQTLGPWLVSFQDGTTFPVRVENTEGEPVASADVRNGQEIVFPESRRPGRFSYRFAFVAGDKIHGVFDCPSIIIW